MMEKRPPEDVLYAFSQWLQQWAEYAQVQAELLAGSANPPAPEEGQPPAHWFELIQSGPPAHWLALFEEYGLEPPQMEDPPGDMQTGIQTSGPAPRPLPDWLGEFQRGLAQFTQQPVPLSDTPPVVPEDAAPIPAQVEAQKTGDEQYAVDAGTSSTEPFLPDASASGQVADGFPPALVSQIQGKGAETWSAPVRLHLNLQPPSVRPVPAPSELRNTIGDARPVPEQPSATALNPVLRLVMGAPVSVGEPPTVQPALQEQQIGEFPRSEPASPLSSIAAPENVLSPLKPNEPDLLTQNDLESIHPSIRQKEVAPLSNSYLSGQNEPPPPVWSQPAAAHWPELPDRLPPVQPPSNVLADPAHRMRINREQRGRSWNT
jgi:hypothetical protein